MTLDRLTITFSWPDKKLWPNDKNGKAWMSYQAEKVRARDEGYWSTKKALGANSIQLQSRTPTKVTFVFPDRRNRDIEGCIGAIKHHIDGIAKALGVDDRIFRPWTVDDALDAKGKGLVIVEIG